MCDCIKKLVASDYIEEEIYYDNDTLDFKHSGKFAIRAYRKNSKDKIIDTHHVFILNYCPACGEKQSHMDKCKDCLNKQYRVLDIKGKIVRLFIFKTIQDLKNNGIEIRKQ